VTLLLNFTELKSAIGCLQAVVNHQGAPGYQQGAPVYFALRPMLSFHTCSDQNAVKFVEPLKSVRAC